MRREHRTAGFTLLEITVAIIILVTLAAVVTPTLGSALDRTRVNTAAAMLDNLSRATAGYRKDVGKYPRNLSQLVDQGEVFAGAPNSCATGTLTGGEANKWGGPYVDRAIPSSGVPTPIGRALNQLNRLHHSATGQGGSVPSVLRIVVVDVSFDDARLLNALVDGDGDLGHSSGAVWWDDTAPGPTTTVWYGLPVSGC